MQCNSIKHSKIYIYIHTCDVTVPYVQLNLLFLPLGYLFRYLSSPLPTRALRRGIANPLLRSRLVSRGSGERSLEDQQALDRLQRAKFDAEV